MNDPNGLVYYRGTYHLFFQHNPLGVNWGNMTWGHAISSDLVHWRQVANALEPDRLGTVFSGSAVIDTQNTAGFQTGEEQVIVLIYTAAGSTSDESQGQPFTQCIAYSYDGGHAFTKYGQNPVLGHLVGENRDPKVVWHAPTQRWIMVLYKEQATYAFFCSPDLKHWTHLHDIDMPGCRECPDLFEMPIDGEEAETRWVFTAANGRYLIGAFDGARYTPKEGPLQVDFGANYYAVQTYSGVPDGRRIQLAWMNEGKFPGMPFNQQMSFPCELRLRKYAEGLRLTRQPVQELASLRQEAQEWQDLMLHPCTDALIECEGDLFEIHAQIEVGIRSEVTLMIRGEPLVYNALTHSLSCLGQECDLLPVHGCIDLHLLIDRTSIEVFAQAGKVSFTSCFLPDPANTHIALRGSDARILELRVYPLRSAWE